MKITLSDLLINEDFYTLFKIKPAISHFRVTDNLPLLINSFPPIIRETSRKLALDLYFWSFLFFVEVDVKEKKSLKTSEIFRRWQGIRIRVGWRKSKTQTTKCSVRYRGAIFGHLLITTSRKALWVANEKLRSRFV